MNSQELEEFWDACMATWFVTIGVRLSCWVAVKDGKATAIKFSNETEWVAH